MTKPPGAPRRARARAIATAVAVVLTSAGVLSLYASRRGAAPPEPASPSARAGTGSEAVEPPAGSPDPRPGLLAARAVLSCGELSGEAVFVSPTRALAGVNCPEGSGQLRLQDGRDLLGRTVAVGPAGTSLVEVPGAGASYVSTAPATALADGAPLLVGLEGAGPGAVAEATAGGFLLVDGNPLLRVEGAAAPVAGMVADGRGNLVGVAPAVPPDPERPWMAVPIEPFAARLGTPVPDGWAPLAERAVDEDRRLLGDLWNRIRRSTVLLATFPSSDGVVLVVARASSGRPPVESLRLAVDPVPRDCRASGRIVEWRTGAHAADGVPVTSQGLSRVLRITPPVGGGAVWIGTGPARLDCDPSRIADGATLLVPGSDPPAPVPFPREIGPGDRRWAGQVPGVAVSPDEPESPASRAAAAEESAAWETAWRQAFREANARVTEARRARLDLEAQREVARGNFQVALEQQLETDLEVARLEEMRAAEALDDLDRRASRAAVPRGWRRAE